MRADAHQIRSTCLICVYRVLSMSVVLTSAQYNLYCVNFSLCLLQCKMLCENNVLL